MASKDRKAVSARTPSAKPVRPTPAKRKRPPAIPSNFYTRKDVVSRGGQMRLRLPTDMVVCLNGLARLYGRTLTEIISAMLWSYLRLTRGDQRKALALDPARPANEVTAWGGVNGDGSLLPWASPSRERLCDVLKDDNRVIRVVIRHLPGDKPLGWAE